MERAAVLCQHITVANTDGTETTTNAAEENDEKHAIVSYRGKKIKVPVEAGTIRSSALIQLGLRTFDPGFINTAVCKSAVTWIDGDKGELLYRGYPIEVLAERANFLEVAFLLIYGELPTPSQFHFWNKKVMAHTFVHEDLKLLLQHFRYDAHPMGMLISSVSAMSTFYPDQNPALRGEDVYNNVKLRNKQIVRLIAKMPTLAAFAYRHRIGRKYMDPQTNLDYCENFLFMMDSSEGEEYRPNPRLVHALEVLFILHADHELNCSTAAMRHITSSRADVYTAVSGATGALYGPLHGGANEAVLAMLEEIGDISNIPSFIENVKARKAKLMGFGHRVYKNYDPRAKIIRKIAYEVFAILGEDPLVKVAVELEKQALKDNYFIERKLYPNVDFWTGLIYKAMGLPTDMFPVLFSIPRTVGWLAHWLEALKDPEKIWRPRQIYVGEPEREFIPGPQRVNNLDSAKDLSITDSGFSKRRNQKA